MERAISDVGCNPDLIIVDCLQELCCNFRKGSPCFHTDAVCRALKSLAETFHAAVLCLSNLSRAPEHRSNHHPIVSDIPHWDVVGRLSDYVCFLYRESYYDPDCKKPDLAELHLVRSADESRKHFGYLLYDYSQGRFQFYDSECDSTGWLI